MGPGGAEIAIDWRSVLHPLDETDRRVAPGRWVELARSVLEYAPRGVRLRPGVSPEDLPFETRPVGWFSRARWLADCSIRPGAYLHHAAADYYVQDPGSTLAVELSQIEPGQWVFDACAAPGGKSTAILERLAGRGGLLANEVIRSRVKTLELTLQRSGFANWCVISADLERLPGTLRDRLDCVVVDAPCSGQSLVGKHRQSMSAFSTRQVEHCASRQLRILQAAAALVRPGGRLVYSTCTFSYAENEQIVSRFLESHSEWETVRLPELAPWEVAGHPGCYRVWPHLDPAAGSFATALVRSPGLARPAGRPEGGVGLGHRRRRSAAGRFSAPGIRTVPVPPNVPWGRWRDGNLQWAIRGDALMVYPPEMGPWIAGMRCSGLTVAQQRGGAWHPSYGCGRAAEWLLESFPVWDLDEDQSIQYVRGDGVPISGSGGGGGSGWYVVRWQGRRLGWAKAVGGQLKNHFPKGLRQACVAR